MMKVNKFWPISEQVRVVYMQFSDQSLRIDKGRAPQRNFLLTLLQGIYWENE